MSWEGKEVVSHPGFNTWGLKRSPGFYISSFLRNKFKTQRAEYRVWTYTDVGLILISENSIYQSNRSMYVANPFSQQCVEIPSHAHLKEYSWPLGIATETENGVLLGYKVVLFSDWDNTNTNFSLLIYSSKTGLWSLNTVHFSLSPYYLRSPLSLQWTIQCHARNSDWEEVVVSIDLYATVAGSVQCRVTPFPDPGTHCKCSRSCTTCQGFLMYMNIISITKVDGSVEDKLCVWRLESEEWQLVSEITLAFSVTSLKYFPLGIDPFDAKTVYIWSTKHQSLISINLHNGTFELHSELGHNRGDRIQISFDYIREKVMKYVKGSIFSLSCIFPEWLHQIPMRNV